VNPQHALEAALRDLGREQLMERVAIRRLGEEGTAALIAETIRTGSAGGEMESASEFAALIHRHTDGNPFFTSQVLQALIENCSVYRQDGRWEWRAVQEIDVPESVRSVIGQRISRLPQQAQDILHEASVLGQTFAFDDLQEMSAREEEEVDTALAEAAAVGLIHVAGNDRYVFDHALTQQALYAALSPRRRKRLHLAAGEALATLPERKRSQRASELAWHFLQGDAAGQALPYAMLAGEQAEAVFAHGEAEQRFQMALELADEIGDAAHQARAREKLGEVRTILGQSDAALEMLEPAASLYREVVRDSEGEGRVMAQIGLIHGWRSGPEDGIARLQPLVAARDRGETSHSLALLYAALVQLYGSIGWTSEQFAASERLLALAQNLDDERLLAEAELHRGVSLWHSDHYDEALRMLEAAVSRAEAVGDLSTLARALDFSARVHHGLHGLREKDRGMMYRERAMEVAERLGDPREISYRAVEYAYLAFIMGDWSLSREYAERALSAALALDTLAPYFQPLYLMSELCIYQGGWVDAAGYLKESVAVAEHLGLAETLREIQGLLAEWDLLRGEAERALTRLQPLLDSQGWEDHLHFLLSLASTYLATGDLTRAEEVATKALAVALRERVPLGQVETLRVQGAIAAHACQWEEAESRFQRGLTRASEAGGYPWGEARILYERVLAYTHKGESLLAGEELSKSRALFEKLGAQPYIKRVDEAVRFLGDSLPMSPR
jgi:tetratricopeptide (TPR) repeat protein